MTIILNDTFSYDGADMDELLQGIRWHHIKMGQPPEKNDSFVLISREDYDTWRMRWRTEMGDTEHVCSCLSIIAHALEMPGYEIDRGEIVQALDKAVLTIRRLWVQSEIQSGIHKAKSPPPSSVEEGEFYWVRTLTVDEIGPWVIAERNGGAWWIGDTKFTDDDFKNFEYEIFPTRIKRPETSL